GRGAGAGRTGGALRRVAGPGPPPLGPAGENGGVNPRSSRSERSGSGPGTALAAEPGERRSRRLPGRWRDRLRSVELLVALVVVAILLRGVLVDLVDGPQISAFLTVFVSVAVAGL